MKIPQHLSLSLITALIAFTPVSAHIVDFENEAVGPLATPNWKQTFQPHGDTTQQYLFSNVPGAGREGSHGVTVNVSDAKSSSRASFQGGVVGESYTVSADFQIAINGKIPQVANHNVLSISLSSTNEWFNINSENSISLNLVRRSKGTRFGFTGIGSDASKTENWRVEGFKENSWIGLPNFLPADGQVAESEWFTLSLTITNAGVDPVVGLLWDVLGEVHDSSGQVVYSHEVKHRSLAKGLAPQSTLYGSLAVPFVNNLQTQSLLIGGIERVTIDNFSLTAE